MSDQRPPFEIFRAADAPTLTDHGSMTYEDMTPVVVAGLQQLSRSNEGGALVSVPYCRPEMSLATLRVKSGYALPLHSHDCNCLYYVAQGSLTIGNETLHAGDGFYVGADVPYGYVAGPEGAIVLEFRAVDSFNVKFGLKTEPAWQNVSRKNEAARPNWAEEELPALT